MQQIDALLLELDTLAWGRMRKAELKALSDMLAHAWESHRGEVLRAPSFTTKRTQSILLGKRDERN